MYSQLIKQQQSHSDFSQYNDDRVIRYATISDSCFYHSAITILSNLTMQIPGISDNSVDTHAATASSLAMTSLGIPLTGSMSAGFTIAFIKG